MYDYNVGIYKSMAALGLLAFDELVQLCHVQ